MQYLTGKRRSVAEQITPTGDNDRPPRSNTIQRMYIHVFKWVFSCKYILGVWPVWPVVQFIRCIVETGVLFRYIVVIIVCIAVIQKFTYFVLPLHWILPLRDEWSLILSCFIEEFPCCVIIITHWYIDLRNDAWMSFWVKAGQSFHTGVSGLIAYIWGRPLMNKGWSWNTQRTSRRAGERGMW